MNDTTTIYTVIPFFSDGTTINTNEVKSFLFHNEAYVYGNNFQNYEISENELLTTC